MTEKDLKELGFKKTKISALESGASPYYFYSYFFKKASSSLSLISTDSDTAKEDGKWKVELYDENLRPFKNKQEIRRYIKLIESLEK